MDNNPFALDRVELAFQKIQQPPGCDIVLLEDTPIEHINGHFLNKYVRMCLLIDQDSTDKLIVILGAHKIANRRRGDQSVPYCKISSWRSW
jgi:hypothetical protein